MAYIKKQVTYKKKSVVKRKTKKPGYSGAGDYKWVNDGPMTKTGATLGKSLGNRFGMGGIGQSVGHYLGNGLGNIFGTGDYYGPLNSQIGKNSIINPSRNIQPTLISGVGKHGNSIIVRKREYIQDIISSATPNTPVFNTFPLNPAQIKTFPFLSQVAQLYEQYIIRGMVFEFKSLSADAMSTTAVGLGYVAMATQYDVLDPPFANKSALENYEFSQSCKPSMSQSHGVECARSQSTISELYTRTSNPPNGADLRLYDFGTFTVLNSSPSSTPQVLGEIWVEYDVELIKSKLPSTLSGTTQSLHVSRNTLATTNANFGVNPLYNVGTLSNVVSQGYANFTFPNASDWYKIDVILSTSVSFAILPTITVGAGTPINILSTSTTADAASSISSPSNGTNNTNNFLYTVIVQPVLNAAGVPTAQLNMSGGTLNAATTFTVDIFVNKLDSSITN